MTVDRRPETDQRHVTWMSKYTPAPKSIPNRLGLEERERADSQRSGDNPKRLTLGQEQRSETRSRTESTRADGMTLIGIRVTPSEIVVILEDWTRTCAPVRP